MGRSDTLLIGRIKQILLYSYLEHIFLCCLLISVNVFTLSNCINVCRYRKY